MPVSEQDREAAEPFMGDAVHYGHLDDHKLIQAFAAHRQRGAEERQAAIVAWLRYQTRVTGPALADAIEAGAHMEKRDG